MEHAIDALIEIFTWVGIGAGLLLGLVALILRIVDGTWVPVHVLLEDGPTGRVARWFDRGGVGEAALTHEQERTLAGKDAADVFARRGRIRLTHGSPGVRAVALLAGGMLALGLIALATSWVLLFVRG